MSENDEIDDDEIKDLAAGGSVVVVVVCLSSLLPPHPGVSGLSGHPGASRVILGSLGSLMHPGVFGALLPSDFFPFGGPSHQEEEGSWGP